MPSPSLPSNRFSGQITNLWRIQLQSDAPLAILVAGNQYLYNIMKYYTIDIKKPFDCEITAEKIKKGDVGIYSKHIISAIKDCSILEIKTPTGITYVDPRKVKKERRIIYRHYLKPEPMMLYLHSPDYSITKEVFEPKEEKKVTLNEALSGIPDKYRLQIRAKLGLH